jgi:hypothetical protein
MVSPWQADSAEAMKALHTPTTPGFHRRHRRRGNHISRRLFTGRHAGRRRRKGGLVAQVLKAAAALALAGAAAFGAGAAAGAIDGPKVLAVAKRNAVAAAGRVACAALGAQVVAGAPPCAGEATPVPEERVPMQKAPPVVKPKRAPPPPPPSHVKMLFRNTRGEGTLTVHSIDAEGAAAYHSKLAPREEHTYYIAVDQELEFRHAGRGEGVAADWRARVRPFATPRDDDDPDEGDDAPAFGLVFENPLEEHIALEIAREGIWVDPRKKVAYTAEEGHAFHVKDRAQGDRFGCAVYEVGAEELARLAKRRADREAAAAKAKAAEAERARKDAARIANEKLSAEAAARAAREADEKRAAARAANAKAAKAKPAAKPKPDLKAKAAAKPAPPAKKDPPKAPPKPPAAKKPEPPKKAPAKPAPPKAPPKAPPAAKKPEPPKKAPPAPKKTEEKPKAAPPPKKA